LKVEKHWTTGYVVNLAFKEFCEEDPEEPTFVMHHPSLIIQ
jgi:lysyl-tRNA synthetase class 2